jgi:heat-inducible transcriptional repressor
MPNLTKRQEVILSLIVREYVEKPNPVSSKLLVEEYDLNVSSATVRNDMAVLEEAGLITSPHTSAGRVPTEDGYRYFVQRLIRDPDLTVDERRMISHQFHQTGVDVEKSMQLAANVLAQSVRTASLVTSPRLPNAEFKHLQLISTQGRMVLMILVVEGGDFRQQMLNLAEPVSQERLTATSQRVNALCAGHTSAEIRQMAGEQPTLEAEVMEMAADLIDRLGGRTRIVYTDGLMHMLDTHMQFETLGEGGAEEALKGVPEVDTAGARQTLRLLEDTRLLEDVITDVVEPDMQGVLVVVSGDDRWEDLSHTSMILSRYGADGRATGALGVIGPTRLPYGRAVAIVRYMANLMSTIVSDAYGASPQQGEDETRKM